MVVGDSRDGTLYTVAFHPDGKHVYGGMGDGIRRWRVADGQEVGKQTGIDMNATSVSRDGKWIVCGTTQGASVWDAELQKKVVEVEHRNNVGAVDISPESTRFATATGYGQKASIWSITTGEISIGPLEHDSAVRGIKFSPDGKHIATACPDSIYIFDCFNGDRLLTVRNLLPGNFQMFPLVWPSDSRLFVISAGGKIKSFDTSTGSQLAEWHIHSHDSDAVMSIAQSSNSRFIASSATQSVSFWDTSTHTQLGSVLKDDYRIRSITLSADGTHLATGGQHNNKITIWNLSDILPESYLPITVSATFPMLGGLIKFVYISKTLNPRM